MTASHLSFALFLVGASLLACSEDSKSPTTSGAAGAAQAGSGGNGKAGQGQAGQGQAGQGQAGQGQAGQGQAGQGQAGQGQAGSGGDPTPAGPMYAACEDECNLQKPIECPNEPKDKASCYANCDKEIGEILGGKDVCAGTLPALVECSKNLPADSWECDDKGETSVKDGFCLDEFQIVKDCLANN